MAGQYKNQGERELGLKNKRKYVFEHKNTKEIEGFNDLQMAQTIATSPSWVAVSTAAKALTKKMKAAATKTTPEA